MGSAILDATRTVRIAISEKGYENARPSALRDSGHDEKYAIAKEARYTDEYVDNVRTGLRSCKVINDLKFGLLVECGGLTRSW